MAKKNTTTASATTQPDASFNVTLKHIKELKFNDANPRAEEPFESLLPLALSIAEFGLLSPLIVTQDPLDEKYIVICGNRRLEALTMSERSSALGDNKFRRLMTDEQKDRIDRLINNIPVVDKAFHNPELVIVENSLRKPLDPIMESVFVYKTLLKGNDSISNGAEDLAKSMGQSIAWIRSCVRIARLADEMPELHDLHQNYPLSFDILNLMAKLGGKERESMFRLCLEQKGFDSVRGFKKALYSIQSQQPSLSCAPWLSYGNGQYDAIGLNKCAGCQFATIEQPDLFGDVKIDAVRCVNKDCFDAKKEAWNEQAPKLLKGELKKFGQKEFIMIGDSWGSEIENGCLPQRAYKVIDEPVEGAKLAMVGEARYSNLVVGQVKLIKLNEVVEKVVDGKTVKDYVDPEKEAEDNSPVSENDWNYRNWIRTNIDHQFKLELAKLLAAKFLTAKSSFSSYVTLRRAFKMPFVAKLLCEVQINRSLEDLLETSDEELKRFVRCWYQVDKRVVVDHLIKNDQSYLDFVNFYVLNGIYDLVDDYVSGDVGPQYIIDAIGEVDLMDEHVRILNQVKAAALAKIPANYPPIPEDYLTVTSIEALFNSKNNPNEQEADQDEE